MPSHPSFKFLPDVAEEAFRSFLGAPIMHQRQVVGILVVQQKESRLFDEGRVLHGHPGGSAGCPHRLSPGQGVAAEDRLEQAAARYCRANWHRHRPRPGCGVRARRSNTITPRKDEDHAKQLARLELAVEEVRHDLESLALRFRESCSQDSVAIFDIYLHLLNDPGYIKPIRKQGQQRNTGRRSRRSNSSAIG